MKKKINSLNVVRQMWAIITRLILLMIINFLMFCSKILVKNSRNAFASPFLKFAQSFEACKLNFRVRSQKTDLAARPSAALEIVWVNFTKNFYCRRTAWWTPSAFSKKSCQKIFWGFFETSNALAVYCELFQLIIFKRFLILSKSTLSGFIVCTLYISSKNVILFLLKQS